MTDDALPRARRLPCASLPDGQLELMLDAAASRHARVLRLGVGDELVLIDGAGREADARIVSQSTAGVRCAVIASRSVPAPATALHCVVGLPKGDKLEPVARMLTELGVTALHLAQCERSVPRPKDHSARLQRLARIALEACAQSGQARATALHPLAPLAEVAARAPAGAHKLVFWEGGGEPLDRVMQPLAGASEAWVVIGPEGGLARGEVQQLQDCGFQAVGLGAPILRVETAVLVVAALVLDRLGRLRPA